MTETIRESQCDKSIKNTIERLLDRWAELDNIFMSSDNLYLGRSEVLINAFYQASIK